MPGGRHQIGIPAGFNSESVAGFLSECLAGFLGIRTVAEEITSISADFLVVDVVLQNRSPEDNFPANRENNRENAREGEVERA
jgi:hypothetical protein